MRISSSGSSIVGREMRKPSAALLLLTSSPYESAVANDGWGKSRAAGPKSVVKRDGKRRAALSQEEATSAAVCAKFIALLLFNSVWVWE